MSTPNPPRDAENWARPVDKLEVISVPAEAVNLNVQGKRLTGPLRGFGQMWQKTYSVRLAGANLTPRELIKVWKAEFPNFWPPGNRFYAPPRGVQPGEVAVLNLAGPSGASLLATGVMVIYTDEDSFSFMTPEGHVFAGLITFSAHEAEGATVAQIQALVRANDPLYELGCRLGLVHKAEDAFWRATLRNLAARFGVNGQPQQTTVLVDPRVRWSAVGNVWHNSGIRTLFYLLGARLKKMIGR